MLDEDHKKHLVYFKTSDARIGFRTVELKEKTTTLSAQSGETGDVSMDVSELEKAPPHPRTTQTSHKKKGKEKAVIDPVVEDDDMTSS